MKSFVYNFRKQFDAYLRPCLLFRKKIQKLKLKQSLSFCEMFSFLPMSTKVSAEKKYLFSVFRNEIQKFGFFKLTQTLSFYISLYNYRRIQNKTNSAHSFVGISNENKYAKFSCNAFKFSHSFLFNILSYDYFQWAFVYTLENDLIFTMNHVYCLEKAVYELQLKQSPFFSEIVTFLPMLTKVSAEKKNFLQLGSKYRYQVP